MATLAGSTIESTYDQLLALPSNGGNGTNLVALTDGNADTTFALSVATTSIAISATDKFYFDDGGNTYIHEAAADRLDFVVGGDTDGFVLKLDTTTKVGIGTNSPTGTLDVTSTGTASIYLTTDGGSNSVIAFDETGGSIVGFVGWDFSDDNFKMIAGSSFDGATTGIILDTAGKVGIGIKDPDSQLEISTTDASGTYGAKSIHLSGDSGNTRLLIGSTTTNTISYIQPGNNYDLQIRDDQGAAIMHFDESAGNVGIGTAAPATTLEVEANNAMGSAVFDGGDADMLAIFENTNNTAYGAAAIKLKKTHADADHLICWNSANDADSKFVLWDICTGGTAGERLTILTSGNVGIGAATPTRKLEVWENADDAYVAHIENTHNTGYGMKVKAGSTSGEYIFVCEPDANTSNDMLFAVRADGSVGIGTSVPPFLLSVVHATAPVLSLARHDSDIRADERLGSIHFSGTENGTTFGEGASISAYADETWTVGSAEGTYLSFLTTDNTTHGTDERMRIDHNGNVFIGQYAQSNPAGNNVDGTVMGATSGINSQIEGAAHKIGRGQDGDIISFYSAGGAEGAIAISGSTTSLTGFSGNHESSGIDSNTDAGTVVSTIDELDTYTEDSHPKKGQIRENHPKVKVSDSVGDKRIFGVVSKVPAQDGKVLIDAVGISAVRVTGTCEGGDLLESNGDGTAKVQSDDIIKSKTIGKVTIGNSGSGVKLVPCVLYCG